MGRRLYYDFLHLMLLQPIVRRTGLGCHTYRLFPRERAAPHSWGRQVDPRIYCFAGPPVRIDMKYASTSSASGPCGLSATIRSDTLWNPRSTAIFMAC